MSKFYVYILLFMVTEVFICVQSFMNVYPKIKQRPIDPRGDPGEPVFLTPLIEAGKIKQARSYSRVKFEGFKYTDSYSGYLTVNKTYNSNLFFWYFPAQSNAATAPVVLWLQGGPGATSLIGLFTENGPFYIKQKHHIKTRKYSWTRTHNVIYIDNPVGTGFSFTDDDLGYAKNEIHVGNNLYHALLQFFTLFPALQKNEFYITGESYAGKYVPAISYTIYKENQNAKLKINLKGLAIGNGLSDPEHQLKYGDYLYQLGLIDLVARDEFHKYEALGVKYIKERNFSAAFDIFDLLLNGDMTAEPSLFTNVTGFKYYFNYLHTKDDSSIDSMGSFVQRNDVRFAIHVGNLSFNNGSIVENHLKNDVMDSVASWISELLSHYRCIVYNGQLDIIVAYPLTLNYLQNLNFSSAAEYKNATRHIWKVDGEIAGYAKVAGNLTEVLVRNAGHMVPTDQPKWAFDLLTRLTSNKPFY